jgi:hypothetical protein
MDHNVEEYNKVKRLVKIAFNISRFSAVLSILLLLMLVLKVLHKL